MKFLLTLADSRRPGSLALRMRLKRFEFFKSLIQKIPRPFRLLDLGGTQSFWELMGFAQTEGIEFWLLNLKPEKVHFPNFKSIVGDARCLQEFSDQQFDVVFSNSVIEHLGTFSAQHRMADEIQRVGKRHFVQTPNFHFPIEPHFLFPFFQYLPLRIQTAMLSTLDLGWRKKTRDAKKAREIARSIRLLTRKELHRLFPHSQITEEKVLGLTKSFMVHRGF